MSKKIHNFDDDRVLMEREAKFAYEQEKAKEGMPALCQSCGLLGRYGCCCNYCGEGIVEGSIQWHLIPRSPAGL